MTYIKQNKCKTEHCKNDVYPNQKYCSKKCAPPDYREQGSTAADQLVPRELQKRRDKK